MKNIIDQIHNLAFKATAEIAKNKLTKITDEDVDKLAEAIEFLNDIFEELYDKVFEESEKE